jgi:hypothetical protein
MVTVQCTLYRQSTRQVLTRVSKGIRVDGGIFEKCIVLGELYRLCHLNNKYGYKKEHVISLSYQQLCNCTIK